MYKLGFKEAEVKLPTFNGSFRKQGSSPKTPTSASLTTLKPMPVWITKNWKILKEIGIPDHLTCLLRNLHAGQETTVRNGHGIAHYTMCANRVPNQERSRSRVYIVTLLISLICRVHHVKCQAG